MVMTVERDPETVPDLYFSFASEEGFLGAVFTGGGDLDVVLRRLTAIGLNPGGEVMIWEVPPGQGPHDILLDREGLAQLGNKDSFHDMSPGAVELLKSFGATVCEDCNRDLKG